jgi:hypothetical protein
VVAERFLEVGCSLISSLIIPVGEKGGRELKIETFWALKWPFGAKKVFFKLMYIKPPMYLFLYDTWTY